MIATHLSQSEILKKFSSIVANSLRIDPALVVPEAYLDDLGAESLDLIEISMEAETHFNIWLPEKSILDTANEVFGAGVLERDGYLTEAGKELMRRRMPESDAAAFSGEVTVKDLRRYFIKVSTWVRLIQSLMESTPAVCEQCGGPLQPGTALKMKCIQCGAETNMRSGEEVNREWVRDYYQRAYVQSIHGLASAGNLAQ
ncbi:MAG TPA: phosphopantetheine-binding protein [Bryobacteraceae bacterium]|jgi:acyl carrier protein|nr:phosphopantetheine-binding protein [Bryobacteraceae bacterium]